MIQVSFPLVNIYLHAFVMLHVHERADG